MSDEERKKKWRWAHSSEEAKHVRKMEKEFHDKLNALKNLAFEEKIVKKKIADQKFLEIVDKCKAHGGPMTMNEVEKLDSLSYKEILLEVKFLKRTTAPQLRIRRKVEKRFVNYTREELIQQMKDVLKPSESSVDCIENLLASALNISVSDCNEQKENDQSSSETTH